MENTVEKCKPCYLCGNFSGYYTKGKSSFERTKVGYCIVQGKLMGNNDNCDRWRTNSGRQYICKKTSLTVLYYLLTNLTGIRQILEEAEENGIPEDKK